MFEDKIGQQAAPKPGAPINTPAPGGSASPNMLPGSGSHYDISESNPMMKKILGIIMVVVVLGALGYGAFWGYKKLSKKAPSSVPTVSDNKDASNLIEESQQAANLPGNQDVNVHFASSTNGLGEIEYLSFFNFYKAPAQDFKAKVDDYSLPLNVKTDVVNYYDISRKINLDKVLSSLNQNGFALVDNPFKTVEGAKPINDFYSLYDTLYNKQIPLLVSSDFITYYYQNSLKKVFKDVEENLFYDNLWDISYKLFDKAKERYDARLKEVGPINDVILEGARLEMAYFATALSILKPADTQINQKNDLSDKSKFTLKEAEDFSFNPPQYLKVDVLKEVDLIRAHKEKTKSPVLLYERDYKEFVVPQDYQSNAKLNNFYLTTRWLNSNLPLYYRASTCDTCSLDYEDWRIQMVASSFMSRDVFGDQGIKNKWARIYKTLTFFKGLRDDLSLVNFRDSAREVFGQDYNEVAVFGPDNPERDNNFKLLQEKLASLNFAAQDGAFDKALAENKSKLGVKFLADPYWPNDYIFSQVSTPTVGNYLGSKPATYNVTACRLANVYKRCLGFGLDVINLLYPTPLNNDYFKENTNYDKYNEKIEIAREGLKNFGDNWHKNNFWSTLASIKSALEFSRDNWPVFGRNEAWTSRQINLSLASWTNLQLPLDKWSLYQKYSQPENIGASGEALRYAYVEPNLALLDEYIANTEMVYGMFDALNLNEEVKSVAINISDLNYKLKNLRSIVIKELSSEDLDDKDFQLIDQLAKEYKVETLGNKSFRLSGAKNMGLTEDLSGLRLLVLIHKRGNDLIFSIGPIFNYWEKK